MDDLIDLPIRTVTCHTAGCASQDIPITFPCADAVSCGVCAEFISDMEES